MLKLNSISKVRLIFALIAFLFVIPVFAQTKSDKKPKETRKQDNTEKATQNQPNAREREIEDSWLKELNAETNTNDTNQNANSTDLESNTQSTDVGSQSMFAEDAAPSFIGLLLRFIFVVGLMGGGLYLFVRFFKRKVGIMGPTEGGQLIQVIASVPVMPGKFVQIVELAGQMLVLGTSDSGVRLIYIIEDATTAERIRLWHQNRPKPTATSMLDLIQKSIKKGEFKFWGDERVEDRPDFSQLLNGQSNEMADQRLHDLLKAQKQKIQKTTKFEQD
ncbi:MAG: FliO/MopB family protein [Leptonema sp. (in: Bacteria)]|nr:FliO/MopB family protein [Leptonema sp. (in: bacteria)]